MFEKKSQKENRQLPCEPKQKFCKQCQESLKHEKRISPAFTPCVLLKNIYNLTSHDFGTKS